MPHVPQLPIHSVEPEELKSVGFNTQAAMRSPIKEGLP